MSELILSLFPGIGLLDMAFEEQGFCIVRGPDKLWGGDIRNFHPPVGHFDGVIGGPPCQAFSQLVHLVIANGLQPAENLIPEFERVVQEAQPKWYLMENVVKAPLPSIPGYWTSNLILNARWFGAEQERKRRFTFGLFTNDPLNTFADLRKYLDVSIFENPARSPAVCASGVVKPGITGDRKTRAKYLGWKTAEALKESIRLQGLPENFLSSAPFTLAGKHKCVGNGVPLPLGRAIALAVSRAVRPN